MQRQLEFVRISVDFLSLIERGINAPSFETMEHMANKLRVPVMELFDFRGRDRSGIEPPEVATLPHPLSDGSHHPCDLGDGSGLECSCYGLT
jgi:hypothetical protein